MILNSQRASSVESNERTTDENSTASLLTSLDYHYLSKIARSLRYGDLMVLLRIFQLISSQIQPVLCPTTLRPIKECDLS